MNAADVANVIAGCALFVATGGGIIAYGAFLRTAEDTANAHMHGMFCDFLQKRLEYAETEGPRVQHLRAFKIYALEEMEAWVRAQKRKLRSVLFPPWGAYQRAVRKDALCAWDETIVSFLADWADTDEEIRLSGPCYGTPMLRFIQKHSNGKTPSVDQELVDRAKANKDGNACLRMAAESERISSALGGVNVEVQQGGQ